MVGGGRRAHDVVYDTREVGSDVDHGLGLGVGLGVGWETRAVWWEPSRCVVIVIVIVIGVSLWDGSEPYANVVEVLAIEKCQAFVCLFSSEGDGV